jgi:hypothetical protein
MTRQLHILLAKLEKLVVCHHCVPIAAVFFEHLSANGAVLAQLANVAFFERACVVTLVQHAIHDARGQIGLFYLLVGVRVGVLQSLR